MSGVAAIAALWAVLCQATAATAPGQAVEAVTDEVSLLQRSLGLSVESPGPQQEPAKPPRHLQLTQSASQRAHIIPSRAINLDLPPEERWYAAFGDELKDLARLVQGYPLDRTLLDDVDFSPFEEQLREMRGIVKAVDNPDYTLDHLLAGEVSYERGITGCTGLLAATANGTVFHGRNLDLFPDYRVNYENLVREVTYYRGGKPLFSTSIFGMAPGVHTAYRIGGYSVAQNTRKGCADAANNLVAARRGGQPFTLLMRKLIQEVSTYEEVVHRLAEAPLIAPQYFTVAGVGAWEGALITRDREGYSAPYPNVEELSPQIGRWYIVQTNDDTWKPATDSRRPTALAKLSTMTPSAINPEAMVDLMTTVPVLNNGTIFTWVLQPSTGMRRVFIGSDELRGDIAVPAFVSDIQLPPGAR